MFELTKKLKMKIVKVLLLSALFTLSSKFSNAQALDVGDVIIEGFYGFPNVFNNSFLDLYSGTEGALNRSIQQITGVGVRGEYMLNETPGAWVYGVGLELGYDAVSASYTENNNSYVSSTKKLGVMASFALHFLFVPDNMDLALTSSVGFGRRTYSFTSTDNFFDVPVIDINRPLAYRLGLTYRYYFNDNIGLLLGVSSGDGGLANFGLSYKL